MMGGVEVEATASAQDKLGEIIRLNNFESEIDSLSQQTHSSTYLPSEIAPEVAAQEIQAIGQASAEDAGAKLEKLQETYCLSKISPEKLVTMKKNLAEKIAASGLSVLHK